MSVEHFLTDPNIPTVGDRFAPLGWIPVSTVQCKCSPRLVVLIVTGWNNPTICGLCKWGYANQGLVPTGDGQMTVRVGALMPIPADAVPNEMSEGTKTVN